MLFQLPFTASFTFFFSFSILFHPAIYWDNYVFNHLFVCEQRYIKFFLHLFLRSSFAFTDQRKTSLTACLSQQNLRRGTLPLICPNPLRPRYINIFMSYFSTGRGLPVFLKYIPCFSSHHESFFLIHCWVWKILWQYLLTADQD